MVVFIILKRIIVRIARSNIRALTIVVLLLLGFGTLGSYLAESRVNDLFRTGWDCLWWSLVTMSTVGYGDKVPITAAGRVIGAVCMVGGPILMVTLVGSVGVSLYNRWTKGMRGMSRTKSKGHIVICTWNQKAREIISELRDMERFRDCPVTVVDDKIDTRPVDDARVSFVRGSPSEIAVLKQANIEEAAYAIILAADSTAASDQRTVLTVLAIESANSSIVSCAELNDGNNEEHLRRSGCDIIVDTPALTSRLLAMSLQSAPVTRIVKELVSGKGSEIYCVETPPQYVGQPFVDSIPDLKKRYDVTAIGIERNGEYLINPPVDAQIEATDLLLVLSEEPPTF